jgi:hypothetical protein
VHLKDSAPCEYCGDRYVDWDEDCDGETDVLCASSTDSAYTTGRLSCTDSCRYDYPGCEPLVCGKGRIENSEEYDDRSTDDYCPEHREDCEICPSDCTIGPGIMATCENGHVFEGSELCDPAADTPCSDYGYDGGVVGCSDDCGLREFSGCEGSVCGNGFLDDGEASDDGTENTFDCEYGDAECEVCTPACEIVTGETSVCVDDVLDDESEDCDPTGSTDSSLCLGGGETVCTELCK